jgi:hypothetical protein
MLPRSALHGLAHVLGLLCFASIAVDPSVWHILVRCDSGLTPITAVVRVLAGI